MGAFTGLTQGKIAKMEMTVKYRVEQHVCTEYRNKQMVGKSCGPILLKFGSQYVIHTTGFSNNGDSGALVLTTSACPQPVGMVVAGNSSTSIVSPISSVLSSLEEAGGLQPNSLSIVPDGGCAPSNQVEVDLPSGGTQFMDGTVPDPDVAQALNALPDFTGLYLVQTLMSEGVVNGVGIDLSTSTASLDVIADDGSYMGQSDLSWAQLYFQGSSFEGVPVEVSEIDIVDVPGADYAVPLQ
jgi:hypothetical protein